MTGNKRILFAIAVTAIETSIAFGAHMLGQAVSPWGPIRGGAGSEIVDINFTAALIYAACVGFFSAFIAHRYYYTSEALSPTEAIAKAVSVVAFGTLAYVSFMAILAFSLTGRYIIVLAGGIATAGIAASYLAEQWIINCFHGPFFIAATKDSIDALARALRKETTSLVLRHVVIEPDRCGAEIFDAVPPGSTVVVSADRETRRLVGSALVGVMDRSLQVVGVETYWEHSRKRIFIDNIDESWLLSFEGQFADRIFGFGKRWFDVVCAALLAIPALPIIAIAAGIIKLQDRGPIIYTQIRRGRVGRDFRLYKLRTMVVASERNGAQWASASDPRVTPFGRFLRRSRIDELPQLANILAGDMSFIGPRPERPEFVEKLIKEIPAFRLRETVKPGLSGWAQINYPYGSTIEDAKNKLAYDLYYVKNMGVRLEFVIFLRTLSVICKGSR